MTARKVKDPADVQLYDTLVDAAYTEFTGKAMQAPLLIPPGHDDALSDVKELLARRRVFLTALSEAYASWRAGE